jgi:hypothetical protein
LLDPADRRCRQIHEQLRQITLRVDGVPLARAGQAAENRGGLAGLRFDQRLLREIISYRDAANSWS